MGNIFAGSEIVDLAVQVEKNGRDFYNAVAANSSQEKPKKLFLFLGQEEEKHILAFRQLAEKVGKYDPPEVYADDYIAYMKALASEHVFTRKDQGREEAKKASSDLDAVNMGIKFEEDSIVFYQGIKQMVPVRDQKIVDEIIAQEQMHLVKLSETKAIL